MNEHDIQSGMEDIQSKIASLQSDLSALNNEYYKNNFSAHQDFNKYSNFTTRLKLPSYTSNPATCQVGEVIENGGVAYICSAANTWTKIGLQT